MRAIQAARYRKPTMPAPEPEVEAAPLVGAAGAPMQVWRYSAEAEVPPTANGNGALPGIVAALERRKTELESLISTLEAARDELHRVTAMIEAAK